METGDPALFAHRCDWQDSTVVAVHNLGRQARPRRRWSSDPRRVAVDDLLELREHKLRKGGTMDVELGRLRLPVAAGAARGPARARLDSPRDHSPSLARSAPSKCAGCAVEPGADEDARASPGA